MRDVMDGREAIDKCEELFEKYGVSADDKNWFIYAFKSLCIRLLLMKKGPFYEQYMRALADEAMEDAQLEVMIQHQKAELEKEQAELDAMIEAMKKAKEN